MASKTFATGTVIDSAWLNDVNNTVYGALNAATSPAQVKASISAASSGVNTDITSLTGLSTPLSIAQGGTGSASQNFVDITTPQTIAGAKTFSSTIVGSINGNAATVTTNANLTGDITSTGNATTYNGTVPVTKGGTGQTSYTDGQLLIGNTLTGGLTKATLTAGSNITITNSNGGISIASTAGGGTVTSVSVVSANGLAGTVATATTTPAITLSTTVTGILSGNGTAISAATTTGSGSVVLATSPALTTPTMTTAAQGTNTTQGASTAFVINEFNKHKNRIINGGMAVDQRNSGAAQTITAGAALAYTVDRWYAYCIGANVTGQRVAGSNQSQYRYQFTGAASVTAIGFAQRIEAVNSYSLNNKTATLSVDLANSLLTSVTWTAYYATTTDTFGTLASPTKTQIATGTFTVNSTVTRYSTNISIPAAATTGIEVVFSVGAQTSGTWTIGDVQLEEGSVATQFEYLNITQIEDQCYRYYFRTQITEAADILAESGFGVSTTTALCQTRFPRRMRAVPSASSFEQTGTATDYSIIRCGLTTSAACSSVPTYHASTTSAVGATIFTVASGLTNGYAGNAASATTSAYLAWSVEL